MGFNLKKGDEVLVIAGADKGKKGKILKTFSENNRVLVEKINMHKKHMKPTQQNPTGGIVSKELPIHRSNVMLLDKNGKRTRIGSKRDKKGEKSRIARTTGEVV